METIDHLRHLFAYNDWANGKVIGNLKQSNLQIARALQVLSHLLLTEKEYRLRMNGKDSTGFDFWKELSLEECESLAAENHNAQQILFADLTEEKLETSARYKNSKGVAYQNTLREMLTHVIYHSAYHRGQVAVAVRTAGEKPAHTDYITFLRAPE